MSTLLEKEEFNSLFETHIDGYISFMHQTLESFNNGLSALDETLESKAKSSLFHALAIKKAKKYFDGKDGIRIVSKYQTIQIFILDKAMGKIKRVNDNKLSANIKTAQVAKIWANEYTLFDLTPVTCIELAYRLDKTCTTFEYLGVVCRQEKNILWDINYGAISGEITVMPTTPIEPIVKPDIKLKIKAS